MYRSGSDTGFYDKCSAVRALRVYLRPRFSLHGTENDNITLRLLKCRYHNDMEFSVWVHHSPVSFLRPSDSQIQTFYGAPQEIYLATNKKFILDLIFLNRFFFLSKFVTHIAHAIFFTNNPSSFSFLGIKYDETFIRNKILSFRLWLMFWLYTYTRDTFLWIFAVAYVVTGFTYEIEKRKKGMGRDELILYLKMMTFMECIVWGSFTVKRNAGGARLRQSCSLTHR